MATEEEKAIARYLREGRRRITKRRVTNIAGLELCKELYRVSGWNDTYFGWSSPNIQSAFVTELPEDFAERTYPLIIPAYDLGYLLRKLPYMDNGGELAIYKVDENRYAALFRRQGYRRKLSVGADTPEDAACKLAIELFRRGVLKRDCIPFMRRNSS
jgi:hypothetical protein